MPAGRSVGPLDWIAERGGCWNPAAREDISRGKGRVGGADCDLKWYESSNNWQDQDGSPSPPLPATRSQGPARPGLAVRRRSDAARPARRTGFAAVPRTE
jgi:hypothetical protein